MKYTSLLSVLLFCIINVSAQTHDRVIKIGAFKNETPYSFIDKHNNPNGFSIEIVKDLMQELNYRYDFIMFERNREYEKSNDSIESALSSCDILINCVYSPIWAKKYYYSTSYCNLNYHILCKRGIVYHGKEDLKGKDVITKKASSSHIILKKFGNDYFNNIIVINNIDAGIGMISSGIGDYMLCNYISSVNHSQQKNANNILTFDSGFPPLKMYIVAKDKKLIDEINVAINKVISSEKYPKTFNKWLITEEGAPIGKYVYIALFVIFIIALLLGLFLLLSRRQVHKAVAEILEAKNQIADLNKSINMHLSESNIQIFTYNAILGTVNILRNNKFEELEYNRSEFESKIHPNDKIIDNELLKQLILGETDKVVIKTRIFDTYEHEYQDMEFIFTHLKDRHTEPHKIIFSQRNETKQKALLRKQEETILNLKMALRSAKLIHWHYNAIKKTNILIDERGREYILKNKKALEKIKPEDRSAFYEFIRNTLIDYNRGKKLQIHIGLFDNAGYKPYEVTAMVRRDCNGEPIDIYGIFRDISEIRNYQLQLNEKIDLLETIKNHMPVGMYFYDKDGRLQDINDSQARFLGLNKDKLIEAHINLFNLKFGSADIFKSLANGQTGQMEIKYSDIYDCLGDYLDTDSQHGELFDVRCSPIFDTKKNIAGYISIYNDITESNRDKLRIQELKNNLILALEAGEMSVWIYDCDTKIFRTLYGELIYTGEMTTDEYYSHVHPNEKEKVHTLMQKIIDHEIKKAEVYIRFKTRNGWRWFSVNFIGKEENGVITQIMGIRKDVTEDLKSKEMLKQANLQLDALNKQNELILNNNASALVYMNTDYVVQWSNSDHVFGEISKGLYNKGEKCHVAFGYKDSPCPNCPAQRTLSTGEICKFEFEVEGRGIFETTSIPVEGDNGIVGIVLKLDNITEWKKLVEELKDAKIKAEESEKSTLNFLVNMTHEIRTPLNTIVGFSELIQQSNSQEEQQKYMKILNTNNELLMGVIGNILDLSKIEAGCIEPQIETFEITDLTEEINTILKKINPNPKVRFTVENSFEKCVISFDKNRLLQIIANFLSNSVKYTPSGEIILSIACIDNGIKVSVKDTGIGIDKENQNFIFGQFRKLDYTTTGSGLGLPICKAITNALNGEIGFESEKGIGSTFWAWFPCQPISMIEKNSILK